MKLGCLIVDCFDVHGFGEVCWADCLGRLVICGLPMVIEDTGAACL